MSNKLKIILGIIFIVIIAIIIYFIINKKTNDIDINKYPDINGTENIQKNDNGSSENISNKIKEDKGYDGYKISGATLTYNNGVTTFKAIIKNVSKGDLIGGLIDIVLLNKQGEEVSKISTYIRNLKADEVMEIDASITQNVVNAYDYKLVSKTK